MTKEPTLSRRRWFQFRLRTLLILVAIVAALLAWIAKERRQSRYEDRIGEELRQHGSFVEVQFDGPFYSSELDVERKPQGWWRDISRKLLGQRLVSLVVVAQDFDGPAPLAGLRSLTQLHLGSSKVRSVASLSELRELRWLNLDSTPVNDVTALRGLGKLEGLGIADTQISDLSPLVGLAKLKEIDVRRTSITKEQIDALQKALPNCKIDHDPFP